MISADTKVRWETRRPSFPHQDTLIEPSQSHHRCLMAWSTHWLGSTWPNVNHAGGGAANIASLHLRSLGFLCRPTGKQPRKWDPQLQDLPFGIQRNPHDSSKALAPSKCPVEQKSRRTKAWPTNWLHQTCHCPKNEHWQQLTKQDRVTTGTLANRQKSLETFLPEYLAILQVYGWQFSAPDSWVVLRQSIMCKGALRAHRFLFCMMPYITS